MESANAEMIRDAAKLGYINQLISTIEDILFQAALFSFCSISNLYFPMANGYSQIYRIKANFFYNPDMNLSKMIAWSQKIRSFEKPVIYSCILFGKNKTILLENLSTSSGW